MSTPFSPDRLGLRARLMTFVLIFAACTIAAVAYVLGTMHRGRPTARPTQPTTAAEVVTHGLTARSEGPLLLFTNLADGATSGRGVRYRAALAPVAAPDGARTLPELYCERIYFAGGRGVCLGEAGGTTALPGGVIGAHAYVFGSDFRIRHDIRLGGVPSRARVSPNGRYGAVTVFVGGHSYADAGFSTATTLVDLETGRRLGNLEAFAVSRDGQPFRSIDFNFWGVTFGPDSDRFYATLGSHKRTYLVEGSVSGRRMRVLRENVECPSVSPDGARLAFKTRPVDGGTTGWRFHVLDLATMKEIALAERRSIDDQIEWLDDHRIVYGDGNTIWVADADGSGTPHKLVSQASSPAVVHGHDIPPSLTATALTLPTADLSIQINASVQSVVVGGTVTYRVIVTNSGAAEATQLKVDYIFAPGLRPVGSLTVTNPGRGYGCSKYDDPGHLSCDTPQLTSGMTWTMSFTARVTEAGSQTVQVIVNGAEPDSQPANDQAEMHTVGLSPATVGSG